MARLAFVVVLLLVLSCSPEQSPTAAVAPSPQSRLAAQTTIGCSGTFDIEVVILPGERRLGETELALIDLAATRWESIITDDVPDMSFVRDNVNEYSPFLESQIQINDWVDDLRIFIRVKTLSGGLGGATWVSWIRTDSSLPIIAEIAIDPSQLEADWVNQGYFYKLVLHEMGHALGFGASFLELNLVQSFNVRGLEFSLFIGRSSRWSYLDLLGPTNEDPNVKVPLAADKVHWDPLTFGDELMIKGWVSPYDTPISQMTVSAMRDIGYQVNSWAADERYVLPQNQAAKPALLPSGNTICHVEQKLPRRR
ncbi:MAG: hypothetical protein OXI58_11260 [Gemmatimonadota bacterium]|nr:hypothetical protein [Gemmatimonadota bacterium]